MNVTKKNWLPILLVAFSLSFYLTNLGNRPLEDYDEATYASVLKSSLERNDFLNFEYFGHNWFEKPPLYFWLAAASVKVLGFNEFALRPPSALAGVIAILLTYLITLELSRDDWPASFFAGTILIFMPFFTAATRNVRMDTPVTVCILTSLYFYLAGLKKENFFLGVGLSIGFGIFMKSIIGLLAMPIILIWSGFTKQWLWLKNKFFWLGNLLGVLVAAPWHIYESVKFGRIFWQDYLGYHVLARFNENILNSKITVGYYLNLLWKLSQPLIILVIASLAVALILLRKRFRKKLGDASFHLISALAVLFFIFTFFSLSKTKLLTYYTYLYPFAAIAGGLVYYDLKNISRRSWLIHSAIIIVAAIFGYYGLREFFYPQIYITRAASDERAIGLYLAKNHNGQEINIFNWDHQNTLRYYANRLTDTLQFNAERKPKIPSWLVMSTETFNLNKQLSALPTPYRGEYLTLVHLINEK